MGQKIHPKGFRIATLCNCRVIPGEIGYTRILRPQDPDYILGKYKPCRTYDWVSNWFNLKDAPKLLEEDMKIREIIKKEIPRGAISEIKIYRTGDRIHIEIHTSRPEVVVGAQQKTKERIEKILEQLTSSKVEIEPLKIERPETDAQLVAESVAVNIEKGANYRWVMRNAIRNAMNAVVSYGGKTYKVCKGIKIQVSGRLGGAEIARTEWMREGRVPLQTLRADIDYGFAEATIKMGKIGVKVWIFKKEHNVMTEEELVSEAIKLSQKELAELAEKNVKPEAVVQDLSNADTI
ncbi:MAG: 30S ribosomal protein S3 [bacterium]|nr:30S ribosomal protein S3 [bacterium]